jgi:hypothetical protein
LTGSAWQTPENIRPAATTSPAASNEEPPAQQRIARAHARPSDQDPAAAVGAIPSQTFSSKILQFNDSAVQRFVAGGTRVPAHSNLELPI